MTKSRQDKQESIRSQLLKITRQRKLQMEQTLTHYAIERLLYRLSISKYKDRFLLKGAMLFTAWQLSDFRTTRDLDLLGFGDNSPEAMKSLFADLFSIEFFDDAITFSADSIAAEEIRKDQEYVGVRIKCFAMLHTAKIPVHIDIGIGDAVFPAPEPFDFPTLLDLPAPKLKAYRMETVIAEKLDAIVQHGRQNTRLKDYYDLLYLSRHFEFKGNVLVTAIKKTFERRRTIPKSEVPIGLSALFYDDPTRIEIWIPFARKMGKLVEGLSLKSLVEEVATFVLPPMHAALFERKNPGTWKPNGPWSNS